MVCRLIPRDLQSLGVRLLSLCNGYNLGLIYCLQILVLYMEDICSYIFMISLKGTEMIKADIMNRRCSVPKNCLYK